MRKGESNERDEVEFISAFEHEKERLIRNVSIERNV
jgi:hypothetical protein